MAANLTPQYLKAEEEYRRATTPDEELRCLEVMLREMPKHKGSEKLQAELKSKISRVEKEAEAERRAARKGTASASHGKGPARPWSSAAQRRQEPARRAA